jgi:hypothetical protein
MSFINNVNALEVARTRTSFREGTSLVLVLYTLHIVLWIVHPEERMELKRAKPYTWAFK